jgi:hypothetical protein
MGGPHVPGFSAWSNFILHSARLDRLLDPSVGSEDEKHRRVTSD